MKEVQTQKETLIESLKLRTGDNQKAALEILDLMKFDLERGDFIGAVYKIGSLNDMLVKSVSMKSTLDGLNYTEQTEGE